MNVSVVGQAVSAVAEARLPPEPSSSVPASTVVGPV